ncbi:hypothetical protein DL95DRAFT_399463 [Leptodontidium sp. 2 PMI_412]|nr:hypothetical protein DL95DRAFT_399463 [Leptodontidium sp. 2 PMI_412]
MGSQESGYPCAPEQPEGDVPSERLNIKVTDNNNEVFVKTKRTTALGKVMDAFGERQGKDVNVPEHESQYHGFKHLDIADGYT